MKIMFTVEVKVPRVPNFIQLENGSWIPLCALKTDGLRDLANAWFVACQARVEAQLKDEEFFYSKCESKNEESQAEHSGG